MSPTPFLQEFRARHGDHRIRERSLPAHPPEFVERPDCDALSPEGARADTAGAQNKSPGHRPGLTHATKFVARYATFFIAFSTPLLIGSAVSVATFCARPASSLPCAVSVSNCMRECAVATSINSDGDFTPNSFSTKVNAALVL